MNNGFWHQIHFFLNWNDLLCQPNMVCWCYAYLIWNTFLMSFEKFNKATFLSLRYIPMNIGRFDFWFNARKTVWKSNECTGLECVCNAFPCSLVHIQRYERDNNNNTNSHNNEKWRERAKPANDWLRLIYKSPWHKYGWTKNI